MISFSNSDCTTDNYYGVLNIPVESIRYFSLFPTQFRLNTTKILSSGKQINSIEDWINSSWSLFTYNDGESFIHSPVMADILIDNGRTINIKINNISKNPGINIPIIYNKRS